VVVIGGETETGKGTLGPAGSRYIPNMGSTVCENECWVVESALEMSFVGGEGEPGEESGAAVGVSA